MRQTGNALYNGADVAALRAHETRVFSDPAVCEALRGMGCEGVRYERSDYGFTSLAITF
jgi:hypothetical protein